MLSDCLRANTQYKREPHSLLPMVIRSAAKSVAEREIRTQCREFQEFGIMANWSDDGTYRTLGICLTTTII